MAAELLQGVGLAHDMTNEVQEAAIRFRELGEPIGFTTVLVGSDPGSERYTQAQIKQGQELGIGVDRLDLPEYISQTGLEERMAELSADPTVDAVLLQHPLPRGLDYLAAISELNPRKDADGMHPVNLGLLVHDPSPEAHPTLFPCTPKAVVELLGHSGVDLEGAHVAVVGRGKTVGMPLNILLGLYNNGPGATVTSLDHRTRHPGAHTWQADVVIGAAGVAGCITEVKPGATLVSVGASYIDGLTYSDFAPSAEHAAGRFVPVKGGVGPVTRAVLWRNVVTCFELQYPDLALAARAVDYAGV